ncbi:SAM-dependent methyltransferase, partial [Streptomyces griseus]|nr:SAM-dependent methyltransferase [Streptomyces griseus]
QEARTDIGVPWMNRDGIRECIPPAYTHHIATALLASRPEVAA